MSENAMATSKSLLSLFYLSLHFYFCKMDNVEFSSDFSSDFDTFSLFNGSQVFPDDIFNYADAEKQSFEDFIEAPTLIPQPETDNEIKSIYFPSIQSAKAFYSENKELLKDWLIILPMSSIGQLRVDQRRPDHECYFSSPDLINIPQ